MKTVVDVKVSEPLPAAEDRVIPPVANRLVMLPPAVGLPAESTVSTNRYAFSPGAYDALSHDNLTVEADLSETVSDRSADLIAKLASRTFTFAVPATKPVTVQTWYPLVATREVHAVPVSEIVAAQVLAVDDLVSALTSGVASRQSQLDEMITEYSHTWTIHRMPAIDRNVLRLAIYELIDRPEVPLAVIINEAVELAKRFSTEESGRYVNGVLSAIAKQVRSKGF